MVNEKWEESGRWRRNEGEGSGRGRNKESGGVRKGEGQDRGQEGIEIREGDESGRGRHHGGRSQPHRPSGCLLLQVVSRVLVVDEGGESPLSSHNLLLSDMDSREASLLVWVRTGPRHGALRIGPAPLNQGGSFTVKDLKRLNVRCEAPEPRQLPGLLGQNQGNHQAFWARTKASTRPSGPFRPGGCLGSGGGFVSLSPAFRYSHDGSETLEDLVDLVASDGSHSVPFVLNVKVSSPLLVIIAETLRS